MPRPRCPNCREPVSPFAAGCALCGADLSAPTPPRARFSLARPGRGGWPEAFDLTHTLMLLALVLLALGAPLFGAVFAFLLAAERNREGDLWVRNAALLAGALAVTQLFLPLAIFGGLRF